MNNKKIFKVTVVLAIVACAIFASYNSWVVKQLTAQQFDIQEDCPSGYQVVTDMYTVQSGDTYWSIAKELKASNDAMSDIDTRDVVNAIYYASDISYIKEGDVLFIPQWKVVGARLADGEFNGYAHR